MKNIVLISLVLLVGGIVCDEAMEVSTLPTTQVPELNGTIEMVTVPSPQPTNAAPPVPVPETTSDPTPIPNVDTTPHAPIPPVPTADPVPPVPVVEPITPTNVTATPPLPSVGPLNSANETIDDEGFDWSQYINEEWIIHKLVVPISFSSSIVLLLIICIPQLRNRLLRPIFNRYFDREVFQSVHRQNKELNNVLV